MSAHQLAGAGLSLGDRADHVECLLGQVVVLAGAYLVETADGVGELDVGARRADENLGHVEGLRQAALDFAGPRHRLLVGPAELVQRQSQKQPTFLRQSRKTDGGSFITTVSSFTQYVCAFTILPLHM